MIKNLKNVYTQFFFIKIFEVQIRTALIVYLNEEERDCSFLL